MKRLTLLILISLSLPFSMIHADKGGAVAGGLIGGFALGSMFNAAAQHRHPQTIIVERPIHENNSQEFESLEQENQRLRQKLENIEEDNENLEEAIISAQQKKIQMLEEQLENIEEDNNTEE